MNRSILIVICDFLLVSLLAFSTVDISKITDPGGQPTIKTDLAITTNNHVDRGQDLGNVMRLALEDERKKRDELVAELVNTRETAARQNVTLAEREKLLGEREKQIAQFQQEIKVKEQLAAQYQEEIKAKEKLANQFQEEIKVKEQLAAQYQKEMKAREQLAAQLQEQKSKVEQQYAASQSNLQALSQDLKRSTTEAVISKEKLAAMDAEYKKKLAQDSELQNQLTRLVESNRLALAERQALASQLLLAENDRKHAAEQAAFMKEEVKQERQERSKLADGVNNLAQEIRSIRTLSPNTIFSEFVTNRVKARFSATRDTLFNIDSVRNRETQTLLVTDGLRTFAVCHVQNTPLVLWTPGIDWRTLTGMLNGPLDSHPIQTISFHETDPRVILIPVNNDVVQKLRSKVYVVSPDPFKYQDAVVVGANEGYYGECKFQMDLTTPEYLKMDHNSIKGLFGKFNPSSGDLVFSKNGEVLGIMVNNSYCLVLHNFGAIATLRLGMDMASQNTGDTLSRLGMYVHSMSPKLQ